MRKNPPVFRTLLVLIYLVSVSVIFTVGSGRADAFNVTEPVVSAPAAGEVDWLTHLNRIRSLANLPPVVEDRVLSRDVYKHCIYMVKNGVIKHDEDPRSPYYSVEGRIAARNSSLTGISMVDMKEFEALDVMISGPFHGLALINPALIKTGFAWFSEPGNYIQYAAGLDICRGVGPIPQSVRYPIMWPGPGKTLHVLQYRCSEAPDPLSGSGYKAPSGPPIYLQLGRGNVTPHVTSHSFKSKGVNLAHYVFDETNYKNRDSHEQKDARLLLSMQSAVIMMPRDPLLPGKQYNVSITTNGKTYSWSFRTAKL